MYRTFTAVDAEAILRASEGAPSSFRSVSRPGHAAGKHLLSSNADMLSRYAEKSNQKTRRKGKMVFNTHLMITAFISSGQMFDVATDVLNAQQTQEALTDFFVNTPRSPGMRAEIVFHGQDRHVMRVAGGGDTVRKIPTQDFFMVLDRVDEQPFRLHIQTFYGTLPYAPRNSATVTLADGTPHHSYFLPLES